MNILLTCAGRREYLVRYFREALSGDGAVYAADRNPQAPAMLAADAAFVVPPVGDPSYRDVLLDLCRQHHVGLLVPLNDLELLPIASWRQSFLEVGTVPVISSPTVIETCWDKWKAYEFLTAKGLPTPPTYCSLEEAVTALACGELAYPLVVKPRWGSASVGVEFCSDAEELSLSYQLEKQRVAARQRAAGVAEDPSRTVLVQQQKVGAEHVLDVVSNLAARYVCTFVKRKLLMRAGETDRAVTVDNARLKGLGRSIGQHLGHVGVLDCDVLVDDAGPWILDMNPRFGGGYPFSHAAGANLPAALIAWATGATPDPHWLQTAPGVMSAKCDRLVVKRGWQTSSGA